jgi:8-oxo-dGTP pyrophosphatase MutT (NUDIX family)
MTNATLCYIVRGDPAREVLLGLKKRGFGAGKFNGFGGKIRPDETVRDAAVREVREETRLVVSPDALRPVGAVTFFFPNRPSFDLHVHVFLVSVWSGEAKETPEMVPRWFAIEQIPFEQMWDDDSHWLPRVLAGAHIEAEFTFAEDNETVLSWTMHDEST